jgi:hypothetical protein
MRPLATLLACLALAGLAVAAEGGAAKSPAAGSYIVVFKSNAAQGPTVATAARQIASAHGASVSFVYSHALEGFAARMSPTAAVAQLAKLGLLPADWESQWIHFLVWSSEDGSNCGFQSLRLSEVLNSAR